MEALSSELSCTCCLLSGPSCVRTAVPQGLVRGNSPQRGYQRLPVCTSVVHTSSRAGDLVCPKAYLLRVPAELCLPKIHHLEGARGRM